MKIQTHQVGTDEALMAFTVISSMVRETTTLTAESGRWTGTPLERFAPAVLEAMAKLAVVEAEIFEIGSAIGMSKMIGFGVTLPPEHGGPPSNN